MTPAIANTPVLHLIAGPNGSGKSTFAERVLQPRTHLAFVNADVIAAERWPGAEEARAYEASKAAAVEREGHLTAGRSFIAETVFSHPSKVALVARAEALGHQVELHVMLLPVDVTAIRVDERVANGGHSVPETKIRERYERLWPLVVAATRLASCTTFYDNSEARTPFRAVAKFTRGRRSGEPDWPGWTPGPLLGL